jgi:hypothetical protein
MLHGGLLDWFPGKSPVVGVEVESGPAKNPFSMAPPSNGDAIVIRIEYESIFQKESLQKDV